MSWRKKTVVVAGDTREMIIRRDGNLVDANHIRRTANSVTVFTSRFVVLNGGRI